MIGSAERPSTALSAKLISMKQNSMATITQPRRGIRTDSIDSSSLGWRRLPAAFAFRRSLGHQPYHTAMDQCSHINVAVLNMPGFPAGGGDIVASDQGARVVQPGEDGHEHGHG